MKLYFIAVVPPQKISEEVTKLKDYVAEVYESKAALRSPPHITLYMPFRWDETKENILETHLQDFLSVKTSFELSLRGFDAFPPRVIFINVEQSQELEDLQENIRGVMTKEILNLQEGNRSKPFHPHLTIAFRDLRKSLFKKAWKEFESSCFNAVFRVDGISLLKHDGTNWQIHNTFLLRAA